MKLTPRCNELFRLLRGARWLSTGQIHRRFFPNASLDAARKRLRKMEGVRFFAETKIALYDHGLDGLPLTAVLVITDGKQRMKNLAQAVNAARQPILFSTLDVVRTQGLLAPVFNRSGEYEPVRLI